MTVRYHQRGNFLRPDYVCQREGIKHGKPICQDIPGAGIDEIIGELLLAMMAPASLEVALSVQSEIAMRVHEADRIRKQQVERARYDSELARRRFMQVDPDNRLVADSLEAEWNERLRALTAAQEDYERQRAADTLVIDEQRRADILALCMDLPKLWRDPKTSMRDRKRVVRLLIDDVTLVRAESIHAHVRWRGGAMQSLELPLPKCAWELRQTSPHVIREIDVLLDHHTDQQIATILNERGHRSGEGLAFDHRIVLRLRRDHGLKSRFQRLREAEMLTLGEMARTLRVSVSTIKNWAGAGLLRAEPWNDKRECQSQGAGGSLRGIRSWLGSAHASRTIEGTPASSRSRLLRPRTKRRLPHVPANRHQDPRRTHL